MVDVHISVSVCQFELCFLQVDVTRRVEFSAHAVEDGVQCTRTCVFAPLL